MLAGACRKSAQEHFLPALLRQWPESPQHILFMVFVTHFLICSTETLTQCQPTMKECYENSGHRVINILFHIPF